MRLIDAKVLESTIQEQTGKCMIKIFEPSVNLILQDIRNAPTVDAEPVKHGRWSEQAIRTTSRGVDEIGYYCLECGYFESYTAKYCAGCGFKMDLKDGETK